MLLRGVWAIRIKSNGTVDVSVKVFFKVQQWMDSHKLETDIVSNVFVRFVPSPVSYWSQRALAGVTLKQTKPMGYKISELNGR